MEFYFWKDSVLNTSLERLIRFFPLLTSLTLSFLSTWLLPFAGHLQSSQSRLEFIGVALGQCGLWATHTEPYQIPNLPLLLILDKMPHCRTWGLTSWVAAEGSVVKPEALGPWLSVVNLNQWDMIGGSYTDQFPFLPPFCGLLWGAACSYSFFWESLKYRVDMPAWWSAASSWLVLKVASAITYFIAYSLVSP